MSRFVVAVALMAVDISACQRQGLSDRPAPLETEVVEPPPDLPLHRPSTLVDFGGDGERYITFTSPARPQEVSADMERRLDAEGWVREGGGEAGVFVKYGRQITLTVEPDPVGSLWRVDY